MTDPLHRLIHAKTEERNTKYCSNRRNLHIKPKQKSISRIAQNTSQRILFDGALGVGQNSKCKSYISSRLKTLSEQTAGTIAYFKYNDEGIRTVRGEILSDRQRLLGIWLRVMRPMRSTRSVIVGIITTPSLNCIICNRDTIMNVQGSY